MNGARLRFAPVWEGTRYAAWLQQLDDRSGAYVLRSISTGEVLYVGESHTGKLRGTLTRHFQRWERQTYNPHGGRRGGHVYDRDDTEAGLIVTEPGMAIATQYALIQQLAPRDNEVAGDSLTEDMDDEVPF